MQLLLFKFSLENCAKRPRFHAEKQQKASGGDTFHLCTDAPILCNAGLVIFWSSDLWIVANFQRRFHSFSSRISRVKNVPHGRDTFSCHIPRGRKCLFGLQLQSARVFRKSVPSINGGKPGRGSGGGPCRPGTLSSAAKDNKHLQSSASRLFFFAVKQVQTYITADCVNSG